MADEIEHAQIAQHFRTELHILRHINTAYVTSTRTAYVASTNTAYVASTRLLVNSAAHRLAYNRVSYSIHQMLSCTLLLL